MFKFDVNEILDAANLKPNVVTRTLVTATCYTVAVTVYPFVFLKHIIFKK